MRRLRELTVTVYLDEKELEQLDELVRLFNAWRSDLQIPPADRENFMAASLALWIREEYLRKTKA